MGEFVDARADDPSFRVTPAQRNEFIRRLQERGIELADSVWAGAANLLDEQLGNEITRYIFGRAVEVQRQMEHDAQVKEAIALLRQTNDPTELLTIAARAQEDSSKN